MSDEKWTPWTVAALGMALVMLAALITGLVVANWTGPIAMVTLPATPPETTQVRVVPPGRRMLPSGEAAPRALEPGALSEAIVQACNEYAEQPDGQLDRAKEVAYRAAYAICLRARGFWK